MLITTSGGGERREGRLRLGRADAAEEEDGGLLGWARRMEAQHPEWWVLLAAAAAWTWMVAVPHASAAHGGHAAHHAPAAPAGPGIAATVVMVLAMMLPLTVGTVRQVARSGTWARRHRAVAGFLAGYLAVWMLMMIAIAGAWSVASARAGWLAAGLAVTAAAALWEVAPAAWRRMRRGRSGEPMPADGWRGDAARARLGAETGVRCGASCWALMAACVALGHSLPVMAALFGVQLSARYPHRPVRVTAAIAVLAVCLAAIAARGTGGHPG